MGNESSKSTKFTRREFIKTSVTTAGSAAVVASLPLEVLADSCMESSRVVKIVGKDVLEEQKVTAAVNKDVVRKMLESGLTKFTGKKSLEEALGVFVNKDDVVGLKINCLGRKHLSTHPQIPEILAEGLEALGVPPDHIYVFDRYRSHLTSAGYTLIDEAGKVRCVGFDNDMDPDATYTTPGGDYTTNWPKLLTQKLTRIINLPVMKNHRISGVTLALKNLAFGLVHPTAGPCHSNHCNPFIANVCSEKPIQDRLVLNILDGILCGFDGGPARCTNDKKAVWNTLYFSVDPVALDAVVRKDVNAVRTKQKMRGIDSSATKHIEMAAKKGLGNADPRKIALVTGKV